MPNASEGEMHLICENLINENNLYEISKKLDLGIHIKAFSGKKNNEIINNKFILSDVLEAIIAAIFLDGGISESKNFIIKNFNFQTNIPDQNPKSELQQKLLSCSSELPIYSLIEKKGPDHKPNFIVQVETFDKKKAIGKGNSIKEAEINAASNLMLLFNKQ